MIENSYIKYFISNCDNDDLCTALKIINPKKSVGSLSAHDNFEGNDYLNFIRLSRLEDESAIGAEPFPGELMNLCYELILLKNILDILVEFYEDQYNNEQFISISSIISPNSKVVVNSKIKQY